MTAGMFGYVVNDALIKWAAQDLPLFESIFIRGIAIVTFLAVLVRVRGATVPLRVYFTRALGIRIAMESLGTVAYLSALTRIPLASLTAILQLVPVAVTFAAARLLRERVSAARLGAVLAGFVGVLFIIRPGSEDFSPWFLCGLATVGVIVVRELATRKIPAEVPGITIALGTGVTIMTLGALVAPFEGWQTPQLGRVLALIAAAGFLSLGYVASVNAVRSGDISFSAPFRYTVLIFAIGLQIIVFGDVPDLFTFVGAAIIAVAGLVAWRTETRATRTRPAELR